jgi:hypothetical protein
VVDLTSEEAFNSPFFLKKQKVENARERENKRALPLSFCGQRSEKKEVILGNTSTSTSGGGEAESKGSAFLAQVISLLYQSMLETRPGSSKCLLVKEGLFGKCDNCYMNNALLYIIIFYFIGQG